MRAFDSSASLQPDLKEGDLQVRSDLPLEDDQPVTVLEDGPDAALQTDTFITGRLGTAPWKIENGVLFLGEGSYNSPGHAAGQWPWHPYREQIHEICGTKNFVASGDFSNAFSFETSDPSKAYEYSTALKSIDLSCWDTSQITSMSHMFAGSTLLESADLGSWNTDACKNLSYLFSGCSNLKQLSLSGWNTARVTDFSSMFQECLALQIEGIESLPTHAAETFSYMFKNCTRIESLDLSRWNTANVTSLSGMFSGCSRLKTLHVNGWDTTNVWSAREFLNGCASLQSIDLSGWHTPNLSNAQSMFNSCRSLQSVNLKHLDTTKLTNITALFSGCRSLTDPILPPLSPVGSLNNVFNDCESLVHLDLSDWNTRQVNSVDRLFYGCSSLRTLNLDGWNMSNVSLGTHNASSVFSGCKELHAIALQITANPLLPLLPDAAQALWYRDRLGPAKIADLSQPDNKKATLYTKEGFDLAKDATIKGLHPSYPKGAEPQIDLYTAGICLLPSQNLYTTRITAGSNGMNTLSCQGRAPFTGTLEASFKTNPGGQIDIESCTIDGLIETADCTGSPVLQNPYVFANGILLEENKDYLLSYQSNIQPGTAWLIVTGLGDYTGTARFPYTIVKKPNPKTNIQIARVMNIDPEYTWTGRPIHPRPAVVIGSTVLSQGTDYELEWTGGVDPGISQIRITGINAYTGTLYCGYSIVKPEPDPISLSAVQIAGLPASIRFEGKPVLFELTLTYGGKALVRDTDYTIWFENNCAPGTASVHLKGKGLYTGTQTLTFTILPAKEDDSSQSSSSSSSSDSTASSDSSTSSASSDSSDSSLSSDSSSNTSESSKPSAGSSSDSTSSDSSSTSSDRNPSGASGSPSSSSSDRFDSSSSSKPSSSKPSDPSSRPSSKPSSTTSPSGSDTAKPSSSTRPSTGSSKGDSSDGKQNQTDPVEAVTMFRLYNPNSGEHFYTASLKEKNVLTSLGWRDEGIGWKAPKSSGYPVFRLYNANAGDHHYTLDAKEKEALVRIGWKYEGIGWYSQSPSEGLPLYRQYNPNARTGSHNFTLSIDENNHLISVGWKAEGISWYGMR